VATAHERDEREAHLLVLAYDHPLDVGEDLVADLLDGAHRTPVVGGRGRCCAGPGRDAGPGPLVPAPHGTWNAATPDLRA
jgi:hypothetical protein